MRTKYAGLIDNKLLSGILDNMAQEQKGEFGFSTLEYEDQLDIIALFVDNPTSYETPYLHSIECDSEVVSSNDITKEEIKDVAKMSNVDMLKRLSKLI